MVLGTPLSEFKDFLRKRKPGEDDGFDRLRRMQAEYVVDNPIMAGFHQNVGDWEGGEIGACTLEFPTLEQATSWLKENPDAGHPKPKRDRR